MNKEIITEFRIQDVSREGDVTLTNAFCAVFGVEGRVFTKEWQVLRIEYFDMIENATLNGAPLTLERGMRGCATAKVKEHLRLGENRLCISFFNDKTVVGQDIGAQLLSFDTAGIKDVKFEQEYSGDSAKISVDMELFGTSDSVRGIATLVSPSGQVFYAGMVNNKCQIKIPSANLWWPEGLGVQNLYKLTVNLYSDNEIVDSYEAKIGLCDVHAVKNERKRRISVNGFDVFLMGAGFTWCEKYGITEEGYRLTKKMLSDAKWAGINTLVMTGGYPADSTLDLCDEMGILVMVGVGAASDMLFGNVERMKKHPSFAGVCVRTGDEEKTRELISLVERSCPDVSVISESDTLLANYYSVPDEKTLSRVVRSEELNIFSPEVEGITDDGVGKKILSDMSDFCRLPTGFSDFAYASQILQCELVKSDVVNARLNRDKYALVYYTSLCDVENRICASGIDNEGRWKALHYEIRDIYRPIFLDAVYGEGEINFRLFNEQKRYFNGYIEYAVQDSANAVLHSGRVDAKAVGHTWVSITVSDALGVVSGREKDCYLVWSLCDSNGEILQESNLLFTKLKNFNFKKPKYRVSVSGTGSDFVAVISADSFVKGVYIDLGDTDAWCEENYFDITYAVPKKISIKTKTAALREKLERELKIRSVYEIGR